MLTGLGIACGLVLGAAIPFATQGFLATILPVQAIASIYPAELGLGVLYGALTALAFALWPLGRAHDVPPRLLFRDDVSTRHRWPRKRYIAGTALAVGVLAALAIWLSGDTRISLVYVGATASVFLLLSLIARAIMAGAPAPAALARPSPARRPSFFFLDVQNSERDAFDALLSREAPDATIDGAPMLRGRIAAINGVPSSEIEAPQGGAWALRGDRGITYAATLPDSSTLTGGDWWAPDHTGANLVSFESEVAEALGLKIGDTVTVNVLGRNITAEIANFRRVDWESLSINFVMVFSPNTFAGAPHTHLRTLTYPDGGTRDAELALLKTVANEFPTVTSIRVKDAIAQVNALVEQLAWAIRAARLGHAALGLVTATFAVIAGALAASFVLVQVMDSQFTFLPATAIGAAIAALVLTVGFGLIGTWRVLGRKPAPVLRNL
eukprot:jgi/Tetstr1/431428/TSEL_002080.t1